MKCEDVSRELIAYLDRRANSAERRLMEDHLVACEACRVRAEEFRKLWGALDEMPVIEPSFGFDARVRQRVAAEPRMRWFGWLVPQPRLALSMVFLVALCVWIVRLPRQGSGVTTSPVEASENEQFQVIRDLGVLEDYDVLTKFDALSELAPPPVQQPEPPRHDQHPTNENGGV